MLWLALYFPRLSIELIEQAHEDIALPPASTPTSTSTPTLALALANHSHILASNGPAAALGVQPGIKRATALALAPELKLFTQEPHREQQALEALALWALQFTPSVSLQYEASLEASLGLKAPTIQSLHDDQALGRPAGLLLEVEASLLMFGGRGKLITLIQKGCPNANFMMRSASAPYPSSAWLLALSNPNESVVSVEHDGELNARLAPLPLALLKAARPHLDILQSIGARSMKDLVQLPRAGLARRFGKALLNELDQALGKQPEPRQFYEAPQEFHLKLELLAQVENAQALLFATQRMLQQLCQWLAVRHAAVRQLELLAEHDDRLANQTKTIDSKTQQSQNLAFTRFEIRLTEPSRDLARLVSLMRERLNLANLRAPAHTLILNCQEIVAIAPPNQDLFPLPQTAREGLGRLIERLQIRLGREQVQQVLLAEDHRPESAYQIQPLEDLKTLTKVTKKSQASSLQLMENTENNLGQSKNLELSLGLPRPLWFLTKPLPITERQHRPFYQSMLHLLAGPERIESGWWDSHLVQRDYFIAEDEQHNLYWLFRQRFPSPGWFIQGRFG